MSLENSSEFLQFFSEAGMNGSEKRSYRFKSFLLNVSERQLLDRDNTVPLTPKSFDTLVYLVVRAGHLVEKEELMKAVWPDSFVEDGNLSRTIHDLRRALGQDKNGNKFIETIPTKGYRFVAEVVPVETVHPKTDSASAPAIPPRSNTRRLLPILAIGIIVVFASSYFLIYKQIAPTGGRRPIAVMPFVNATQDPGRDYLVDGITDSVINQLSRLSGLRVIAGHSVFNYYKGKELDLKKIAGELGVEAIVKGDIKQVDNQLVINVSLVDPNDGAQIWGKQYVKNSLDVIATQNEISQSIAKSLRVNLTDEDKRLLAELPTADPEAYQLYLEARFLGQHQTPVGLMGSLELLSHAIDKDPRFAVAYSEMGMRWVTLGLFFLPPRDAMPKARAYAQKALELDNTLSDPHIILGLVALMYDWDQDKAKEELANGNVVNLRSIETFSCTAHVLQLTGRAADVDDALRRALVDDPISIALTTELGCNSYFAGRFDQSIKEYREALLMGPNNFMAVYGLARTLNYRQQYQEAIDEIEKAKSFMPMLPPIAIAERSYSFGKMGKRAEADAGLESLDEFPKQVFVDPFLKAIICLGLDEKEQTLDWLEKAVDVKSSFIPALVGDPKWDGLRNDPRFQRLLPRLGAALDERTSN